MSTANTKTYKWDDFERCVSDGFGQMIELKVSGKSSGVYPCDVDYQRFHVDHRTHRIVDKKFMVVIGYPSEFREDYDPFFTMMDKMIFHPELESEIIICNASEASECLFDYHFKACGISDIEYKESNLRSLPGEVVLITFKAEYGVENLHYWLIGG